MTTKKLTTEQFIERAKVVHGDKYDYSLVDYKNAATKVSIICPIHGFYEQKANNHINLKQGCPHCAVELRTKNSIALARAEFKDKAKLVHGDRYDYSQTVYVSARTRVKINCPIHGEFEQLARAHLRGSGCQLCSGNKVAKAASEFVSKAQAIHGDKYIYDLVDYQNNKTKVKITCRSHGSWEQTPANHLSGQGCAKCAIAEQGWTRTHFKDKCTKNNNGLGILYILGCWDDQKSEVFIKIGITSRSIKKRYDSKTSMPYNYKVLHEITGDPEYIYDLETKLHKKSKNYSYTPDIPFAGSSTECFKADKDYLSKLNLYMNELIPSF